MSHFRARTYTILYLLVVTPLGFLFKFYTGPGRWWFNDYGVGVLYEIFWILVVFFFFPTKKAANRIPPWVLAITTLIKILQRYHPWYLEKIRLYFLGSVFIGTTFSWWDFLHYTIGCFIGWILAIKLGKSR